MPLALSRVPAAYQSLMQIVSACSPMGSRHARNENAVILTEVNPPVR